MQEILLNSCYGGFSIPYQVRDLIFAMHPPDSDLGPKFFHRSEYSNTLKEEFDPIKAEYILVEGYEDYCADYKLIKGSIIHFRSSSNCRNLVTKGDGFVWSIDSFNNLWRTHPDVIRLCKQHGWINKQFGGTRLRIASIPKGYTYHITEYDGMESLHIIPPTADVLQDLLERVKRSDYTPSNPFTDKLIKGDLSVCQFLSPNIR